MMPWMNMPDLKILDFSAHKNMQITFRRHKWINHGTTTSTGMVPNSPLLMEKA
jgi:hypothetical protein